MSSGFGVFTERGRCFPFWQDFMACYDSSKYPTRECKLQLEDYMECLHHTKEVCQAPTVLWTRHIYGANGRGSA